MKRIKILLGITLILTQGVNTVYADDDVELVQLMSSLQYFSHKLGLSIDSSNKELASFYAHEVEEVLEEAEKVMAYDGFPVGKMVESTVKPAFEKLEDAVKAANWKQADKAFDDLVSSCNSCHQATAHGYIKLERRRDNPYMQSFHAE